MKIKCFSGIFACLLLLSVAVFAQKLNLDNSFPTYTNDSVNIIEILSDGKILIAGDFTTVNGITRKKIARLNADGTLDETFNANDVMTTNSNSGYGIVNSIQILPDGKLLLGGDFGNGSPIEYRKAAIRLNQNGTLDTTLTSTPQIRSELYTNIRKAAQTADGRIIICGDFLVAGNGSQKPYLARFNSSGTYDSTFAVSMNVVCRDVGVQPDGKYLVSNYPDANNNYRLTRFNADDSRDASFNVGEGFGRIKMQSDGKIIGFNSSVRQLNPDGSLYRAFASVSPTGGIVFQSNGKAVITSAGGTDTPFGMSKTLNRFNTDGTFDPTSGVYELTSLSSSSTSYPKDAAITPDGKIIVVGSFTYVSLNYVRTDKFYIARFAPEAIPNKPRFDFDGDGKDDIAVYRPETGVWYVNRSTGGFFAAQFGISTDKPVANDFDGDGRADIAVYRDGAWYWLRSSDSAFAYNTCGLAGDVPQKVQYNGRAGFLVFRPSDGRFYVQPPYQNVQPADMRNMPVSPENIPVVGNYDGDIYDDLAVFRNGNWFVLLTGSTSVRHYGFGQAGDKPVIGDFDGDGRTDYAVFRPSNGVWYIQKSTDGFYAVQWGLPDDLLVPADYDGDGKTDIAVYRPSNGVWYQMLSSGSYRFQQFGVATDIPAQLR